MRAFRALALGAALVWASAAGAQGFEYDCDTPAEHFSEFKVLARTGPQTVSGSMTVRDMYKSSKYRTSGSVRIGLADNGWYAQLRLGGEAKTSKTDLDLQLEIKHPGQESPEEFALGQFKVGTAVPFILTLDAGGSGRATVGGKAYTFSLPGGQSTEITAVCSTGDVLFSDLSFAG